eukprot:5600888-Heterocapsa_arctica.AAC.1
MPAPAASQPPSTSGARAQPRTRASQQTMPLRVPGVCCMLQTTGHSAATACGHALKNAASCPCAESDHQSQTL